jgi:Tol biopolymer transport system component
MLIRDRWMREMVLSADARTIVYTEGTWEEGVGLWRQRLFPGAAAEFIHGTSDRYTTPAVSADGKRVVYAVSGSYREETWKVDLRNGSAGVLLSSTHSDLNPDYSPDGRYIAFHSTRTGASEIWIANRDGSHARRLTTTGARTTATPRWSPDGSWIAFESNQTGKSEVYVIRSSGGPAQRLTDNPATDAIPSWSHDGRTIYFCSDRSGRFEIWKVPAFGGEPQQVTQGGGFAAQESPDGAYLYYSETRNHGPLWRIDLKTGGREQIVPEIRGLFFDVTRDAVYFRTHRAVFRWDAATRETREIIAPAKSMGFGLAVSPDATELLFTQSESAPTDLYMIDGLN